MQGLDGTGGILRADDAEVAALKVPEWDLSSGEEVEVREAAGGEWGPWNPARVGSDGYTMTSFSGETVTAHAVRRPGGADFMRVDEGTTLPQHCDASGRVQLARPNVLMFGDGCFNTERVDAQRGAFEAWERTLPTDVRLAVLEIGAGRAIPVARDESERMVRDFPRATLIRINLDDSEVGEVFEGRGISVGGLGALDALTRIEKLLAA